ncbi:hypothetical protein HNR44_001713 [Geomicrobium halophilum]|uniref:Uncharacterized protein n=1 Tax=Geomicrobium halophilum TaxID=549000 RepID=A0A841PZA9_9BACL|nr:hypothetical protein [Geomicrobium halophilum]MBB6449735.1 hypothetical protein [Geomicrobium halophilum]
MASKQRKFWINDHDWQTFCQYTDRPAQTVRRLVLNYIREKERKTLRQHNMKGGS